jgi:hypothetical protein
MADPKTAAMAKIRALEQAQLMPRATREFMLLTMECVQATRPSSAPAAGQLRFIKLKAFDDQIAGLRAIVRGEA